MRGHSWLICYVQALRKQRVEIAKKRVLDDAVRWAAFDEDSSLDGEVNLLLSIQQVWLLMLNEQLRETAQIVSAQLDGKLSFEDKDIVEVEVEEFMVSLKEVTGMLEDANDEEEQHAHDQSSGRESHGAECDVIVPDTR